MNAIPEFNPDFYIAGGTLDSTASSYVVREADKELLDAVKRGQFCYVLTSRQMGKSSLMVRTASSLKESGVLSVIIDLSDRDTTNTNTEQWYLSQVLDIAQQLGLHEDYLDWWQKQSQWGIVHRFIWFFTQIVLKKVSQPIVIFIDEIDSTLSLPFNCDDYFSMIRALYNKRPFDPALKRLTFVLLGVASPSDLIKDARRTPFNIGTRIQLTDFTIQEAQPLTNGLVCDKKVAEKILENILFFTGGHPYLTQKACLHVAKRVECLSNEEEAYITVQTLIYDIFLSETGQNTDDNLQFIRKRILSSRLDKKLLKSYRPIRQKQTVLDNELDPILTELKLSGLVKSDAGILVIRNFIYERVFDNAWITRALSELAPSAVRTKKFMYDVFISCANRDRDKVQKSLVPHLEAVGQRIWFASQNLLPGQNSEAAIQSAIEQSCKMLAVLSPAAVASPSFIEETKAFLPFTVEGPDRRRIIPILIKPTSNIPRHLASYRWIDFTDQYDESAIKQLLAALDVSQIPSSDEVTELLPIIVDLHDKKAVPVHRYNTAALRKLLTEAFSDEELEGFVYDYLRPIYDQVDLSGSKIQKIQNIIAYVEKNELMDLLLDGIAEERPQQYSNFASLL